MGDTRLLFPLQRETKTPITLAVPMVLGTGSRG